MFGFLSVLVLLIVFRGLALDQQVDDYINRIFSGWPVRALGNSREFASDYVAAVLVCLSIFFAKYLPLRVLGGTVSSVIVYLASFTFVLYLTQRCFSISMPWIHLQCRVTAEFHRTCFGGASFGMGHWILDRAKETLVAKDLQKFTLRNNGIWKPFP